MLELFGQIAVYAVGIILLAGVAAMGILPIVKAWTERRGATSFALVKIRRSGGSFWWLWWRGQFSSADHETWYWLWFAFEWRRKPNTPKKYPRGTKPYV